MDDEDIYPLESFTWWERILFSAPGTYVLTGWTWAYRRWDDFFTYHWLTWFPRWYEWFPPKQPVDVPRETPTSEGDSP